ncbi:ribulokinase [Halobacillus massiliensis]|uniref:ribulokinase n=1 Tax=Halobacillus massiliensis TaxID=1926286 RepID=UPI0009E58072|nr:ribulokinase [Halobacillus massiliensis]
MGNNKYSIGIDFGTESGRAVLVRLEDGQEISEHVTSYPHGVLDRRLPHKNIELGHEWALQHPGDYLEVIRRSVPEVMKDSGVNREDVIGLGIDFTACTMLPIDRNLEPLCFHSTYQDNPHSWVKLWKHHAAQDQANRLNETAERRGEDFLSRYGGKISSEWMIPKIMQIAEESREIFDKTDRFIEATDWVISQLTGELKRNSCTAGYKSIWHKKEGYPSSEFFAALDPKLANLKETKLKGEILPQGSKAGRLKKEMAEAAGLNQGIAVAVGNVDAHSAVPAMGVVSPGKMVVVMGTSTCHMLLGTEEKKIEGMCGVVEDGIIPGYYGYEAGQSAVGDIFGWFVKNQVPAYVYAEAEKENINVHTWLEGKAATYQPGETGLLALDWWNGNRSVLVDTDLSGMILGLTLQTKPEEIYRALLEATGFGTRKIVDAFHQNGVAVDEIYACGGLPQKNKLLMQIYADITNRRIIIGDSVQTPAVGAAMFGAVAAGGEYGGFDSILEAADHMARVKDEVIEPIPENVEIYEELYQEYEKLHDYFGRGENEVLKRLRTIRSHSGEQLLIQK